MKNFLIGMYGEFDERKYERDFRKEFYGIEACMFTDMKQVDLFVNKSKKDGFSFGVHYPLINHNKKIRDPLFLSPNKEEREAAFSDFEYETKLASEIGAKYILAHFPKPFIMDRKLDWSFWRYGEEEEKEYEDEYSYEMLEKYSEEAFQKLSELSKAYNIKVILENDAYNKYFYNSDLLERLFVKYSNIGLCLDFGRLHLLEKVDKDFNGLKIIEKLAQYVCHIHLWNVKADLNASGGHYPVLPEQRKEDGWGDMGLYLKELAKRNKNVTVLFEHRSDLITDIELEKCYEWVNSFFV